MLSRKMKRTEVSSLFDVDIQVPYSIDPVLKRQEIESILRQSDNLVKFYLESPATSIAKKSKQIVDGKMVLFERNGKLEVSLLQRGTREFVARYEYE